jgi:glutamyl-tRNA(Gln) amidotransferase subunit D
MYPIVKIANEKGIFIGMTSQCIDGRVRMTVYESGRDLLNLGIIPLENMIPEVALVKAMWAAGNTEKRDEIKEIMLKKIASEFSI